MTETMRVMVDDENEAVESEAGAGGGAEFSKVLAATLTDAPAPEDLRELKRWLHERPELWRAAGNLADLASDAIITRITNCPGLVEALTAGRLELQRELGYETAPALERLLIESVVLSWLRYHQLEMIYTRVLAGPHTPDMGEYWDKRASAAQRRYLRAAETLSRVRRLALPGVKVSITQQQVNLRGEQHFQLET